MASTLVDSHLVPDEHPVNPGPTTADQDSTTDLHEENTSDLTPPTLDVEAHAVVEASAVDGLDGRATPPSAAATPSSASTDAAEPVRDDALAPGLILHNRWLLEDVIGAGGASIVFRARDIHAGTSTSPSQRIAIKAPRPDAHDARAQQRLTHEFKLAQTLSHPNIVRVCELHVEEQPYFMTMEVIDGKPLSTLLRDRRPLAAPLAHKVLQQSAAALAYAHTHGVVHGDLKPGNVVVTRDEDVKIIDFGAAAAALTDDGRIAAGTPSYASPEVLSGQTPDVRDDVFSFACVAYEVLTGRHPFDRCPSVQARSEGRIPPRAWMLSAGQWLALLSALSWRREERPTDVIELSDALCAAENHRSLSNSMAANDDAPAHEVPEELMPATRGWGFFFFVACALGVTYLAARGPAERVEEKPAITAATDAVDSDTQAVAPAAPASLLGAPAMNQGGSTFSAPEPVVFRSESASGAGPDVGAARTNSEAAESAPPVEKQKKPPAAAPRSEISFDSSHIVTTESSVAAVFLIKRSPPLSGRARVQWEAVSGSAEAGTDFAAKASGSVEFADGQAQRAIYVPLRNDLEPESDERFVVRLANAQNARLGKTKRMTATIRDDDRAP